MNGPPERREPSLVRTPGFVRAYDKLPPDICKTVEAKLRLMLANPQHRGLQNTKLCERHWRIWINVEVRLVYSRRGDILDLVFVGHHRAYEHWLRNSC